MENDKAVAFIAIVPKQVEGACKKSAAECPVKAITIAEEISPLLKLAFQLYKLPKPKPSAKAVKDLIGMIMKMKLH